MRDAARAAVAGQVVELVAGHGNVDGRAALAPVGEQLVERARLEHGA